jgi:hypothetical protein
VGLDRWSSCSGPRRFRILTKSPSATAVLLVALVIGGNATIFSMAHGILALPPSVHTGLVTVSWVAEDGFRKRTTGIASTRTSPRATLRHRGVFRPRDAATRQRQLCGAYRIVSPNYFDTLGMRIVHGRAFTSEAQRGVSEQWPISHLGRRPFKECRGSSARRSR